MIKWKKIRRQFEKHFREVVRIRRRDEKIKYFKEQKLEEFEKPIEDCQKKLKEYYQ